MPGAAGQPHEIIAGGHFIQEDNGELLARKTVAALRGWIASAG